MSNLQQFDLAAVKNINRSQDTWDLLDKLGKGKILNRSNQGNNPGGRNQMTRTLVLYEIP